jgi:hypothetical protein
VFAGTWFSAAGNEIGSLPLGSSSPKINLAIAFPTYEY